MKISFIEVHAGRTFNHPYEAYSNFRVGVTLREAGHEVYDFRNPRPGDRGFQWSEIDPGWMEWSPQEYRLALAHPIARAGFASDLEAMKWADACVLALPSGRSAHLEAGWFAGAGKKVIVFIPEAVEPELMNLLATSVETTVEGLIRALQPASKHCPVCGKVICAAHCPRYELTVGGTRCLSLS